MQNLGSRNATKTDVDVVIELADEMLRSGNYADDDSRASLNLMDELIDRYQVRSDDFRLNYCVKSVAPRFITER